MKKNLLLHLNDLINNKEPSSYNSIKIKIMKNTQFLANRKVGFNDIKGVMFNVNEFIKYPNDENKKNISKIISKIDNNY